MILRPDQVSILLEAAESVSGHRLDRLRRKLVEDNSDANQLELVTLMAALSVCDAAPETDENAAQPRAAADVCMTPSRQQVLVECLHVGADLTPGASLRPSRNVQFAARAEDELERAGVMNGKRVHLRYLTETGEAPRFPPRARLDDLFAGAAFHGFVRQVKEGGEGKGLWHVQQHGFYVEAVGYGPFERESQLPPDFRRHPVYRGIKRKMPQVSKLAAAGNPVLLLIAVTDATSLVRGFAMRTNWTSTRVCLAAFGVHGIGEVLHQPEGLTTLGRIQGSERVAAAVVLELSPRNYWPPHGELQFVPNPKAACPLNQVDLDVLRRMLFITYRTPPLDVSTLRTQYPLRRAAITWNAKPIEHRRAEVDAWIAAAEGGTEPGGELAHFFKHGLSVRVPERLLPLWPDC